MVTFSYLVAHTSPANAENWVRAGGAPHKRHPPASACIALAWRANVIRGIMHFLPSYSLCDFTSDPFSNSCLIFADFCTHSLPSLPIIFPVTV